ncbi:chorismate-binding protein [Gaoshiqia sp. Z1-71]|uniref:chorismate-binding protein n=1 Tax=Gaoshiqia hydrogeniformans TaxID=3290090 RepID=UPI003BF89C53
MNKGNEYSLLLDKILAKNRPFAAWSMPGEELPELLIGEKQDLLLLSDFNKLNGQEGFVFAPFRISETAPLVLLKPGILLKDFRDLQSFDIDSLPACEPPARPAGDYFVIQKEDYLDDIAATIGTLHKTKLSKVIVSRLIPQKREHESVGQLYMQLRSQTPNAFVYLVNLPESGIWMGATPEVLLRSKGKTLETVSLAGTQPRRTDPDYGWHTKDIEEQAFVSRYLLDVLYRFNIHDYTTQGPETMESGRVAHLKTSFYFSAKKIENCLGDFIAELHPTPAVCGFPKSKADQFISKIEKHDRRYYTGYLGPWRLNNSVCLFVNLRCMELTPDQYILYAGGGITSRSVPEEEWEETNNKARTLLSAIEAVQNK